MKQKKLSSLQMWLGDDLQSRLGSMPNKLQKRYDRNFKLAKFWAGFWAIIGSGWFVLTLDEIRKSNQNFFNNWHHFKAFHLGFNWWVFLFDIGTVIWIICLFITILLDDHFNKLRFEKIKSTIIRAPNMNVFPAARTLIEKSYSLIYQLKPYEVKFNTGDYSQIKDLITAIKLILTFLLDTGNRFFSNKAIVGINIMLFIKKDTREDSLFQKINQDNHQLHFRCDEESKLTGILVLIQDFIIDISEPKRIPISPLILPIYDSYYQTYKNPNDESEEFIPAGAMYAYRNETSVVGNTHEDEYYKLLDLRTQKEIKDFFSSKGKGQSVRSFASFRLPASQTNLGEYMGILNMDSDKTFAFGEQKEFINTFYTVIYPSLLAITEQLLFYKNYLNIIL